MGHFIDFIKLPIGFIICLVLPLIGFIAWQTYKLISLYLKAKKLELAEEAEKIQNTKQELSEADKEAIIAEYLAKQKADQAKAEREEKTDQAPPEDDGKSDKDDDEKSDDGEEKS